MEFRFVEEAGSPTASQPKTNGLQFEYIQGAPEVEPEPSGALRQAADIPIQFAKGIGSGVRGFTDIIGADNPVSKSIAGYEDYMDSLLSAESKQDSKRVAQMLQEAKDGGFLDKISAGFEAFASAPLETTANVAGYMVPQLAIGIVGKAAQIGKAAQVGLTLGTGFAQGVGTAKGNIYQNTKEYLREQGVPEDQIEPIAVKAQSYNGENLDQLLLSGGLNALAASTGAEAILTRVLTKQGKEVSGEAVSKILKGVGVNEKTAKSIAPLIAGGGKGIATEAPIEGVQSAQEEVAKNVALQRLGYDVPTFQGAIESATTGVVAGGFVGGLAGGVEALSPEQKEQRDIDKEAERRARELEAGNAAAQAVSTELTRLERGIDNKRMDLDALESTSPEANKMRLDIAADQKKLAALKEQANKLGLSETITEAEKQQIELAKAITKPAPKPLPTDEVLGEQQASIKIKDNIQQKIDPQTGDRISVPIKDFTIETPQKGSAYGYILNNVANIVGIKAPKKEGSVIEAERGTKTYPQVIQKLSESGVTTLRVAMPSEDSRIALEKLVLNGTLSNPRDFSGPSDASYPTTWDIVSEKPSKPVVTEEPPVSMVGKEVIPGVTPVPTPTEPTVKESLPVAQEAPVATKDIFVRLVTNQEKKSEKAKSKGYDTIPDKVGYDVVFKPYGEQGAGYYYTPSKQIEVAKKTSEELSKKEQSDLDWAKGTIAAAEQGVTPAIASLEQAKRIVQKLEPTPVAETPAVTQEFKDELMMYGVAYDGDTRYSVQQSSNGTFRAERIVNGKKEDIQIGLPDIETAQNVILDSVGKEITPVAETAPVVKETPASKPSGMSVEESKAYLEERNKSTIFGYPTQDIMAMQQGKQVGRAIPSAAPAEAPAITPAPVAETPAVTEAPAAEVALSPIVKQSKKRKGILGEQYINKDWTSLTRDELPQLNRELYNYYDWAKTIVDKLIPNANDFEKRALIMELRNEITQETAKPEFKDREQYILAQKVAGELITGERRKILQRAKERAMGDEYAAWEMGGQFEGSPIPVEAFDLNAKGRPIPEGYTKQGDLYVFQPAVSEAPAAEAAPAESEINVPSTIAEVNLKYGGIKTANGTVLPPRFDTVGKIVTERIANLAARLGTEERELGEGKFFDGKWTSYPFVSVKINGQAVQTWRFRSYEQAEAFYDWISSAGDLYNPSPTPTPAVSETITPAAEPADISVGNRIKLGKSPQTYIVEQVVPQSEVEKANDEQYYSVKNEKTGEVQVVEKADMKQVGGKKARKMAGQKPSEPTPANPTASKFEPIGVGRKVVSVTSRPDTSTWQVTSFADEYREQPSGHEGYKTLGEALKNVEYVGPENKQTVALGWHSMDAYFEASKQNLGATKAKPDNFIYASPRRPLSGLRVPDAVQSLSYKTKTGGMAGVVEVSRPLTLDEMVSFELAPINRAASDAYWKSVADAVHLGHENIRAGKESSPKLGEKGGVLIPSREDFIQAGENIYEAGMEFGAWAKQMIQQFGDVVREFLGDVWQVVSGVPAKFNELMGYLPQKGETGAVNIGRGEKQPTNKPTEPTPEQPTPTPEKPTEPVTEVPSGERKEIMGKKIGELKDTPKNIIAKTKALLRERVFDPTQVTEQNTIEAFRALGKLTGNKQERRDFADELNDIATIAEDTGAAAEVSMGAALFVNDLFEYAVRLAAEGQKMMLGIIMTNINRLPTGTEGRSDAGRALRAAREMKDTFLTMAQAEQGAFINYAAEFVYGPNPTKEQIDSIRQGYEAVEEVEEPTEEDLGEELDKTGIQIGVDLVKKIEDDVKNAVAPERDPIVAAMLALQKLGGGTIETKYLPYSKRTSKIKEGVRNILQGGLSNYRKKLVSVAASGLETGFWKTLSNEENKPGSLGELDAAQNRELGNIVKSMLISLGLKGEPPNTKMSIYEQVASILGERPLSKDKIKLADENIRAEIKRKREKELDATEDSDKQDAINVKYDGIESAWDKAMAQQLDMPISESTMRRLIFNELKEENTSIAKLTKLMNEEPAIATSRQDRLVSAIIEKIAGVTFEGQNPADYSTLKEYLSNQLDGLIQERQIKEAAAKAKAKIAKEAKSSVELQAEKAENEAQAQIEKLAKIQSDTLSFEVKLPAEAQMNPVREAVKRALKLNINRMFDPKQSGEIIANFKKSFVKELKELGVEATAAGILADVVSRQIEINSMNNELKSIDRAIEKGPISEIIKAIKDTPLEEQQKPNWRYEVMRDYLRKAGLPLAQAERIAKLMDISLQKRLTQAKEQAFTDAISKTAPWKAGDIRSKRAFQQVIQAIRAGALDPSRNMASDIAALNGWTGFSAEQYKNLLKFDTILADEKTGELEKANAYKGVQDIISKSKLPIRARDVIAQYYDAQALSGIPTLSVNSFSPIAFAMRNAIVEAGSETLKGDPKAIGRTATIFVDSIKSWANTTAFSFKNNVTVYSNVDYIVNDDNLLRLYRKGVDQFQKGNTPRDRADGIKNIMIGMMDYVRRVLNALDYGAIAALQNQNVGKYAMAVMKRNNISEKKANEVFAAMMKEKNDFYLNQIAIGTDKNKASILADEYYVASWGKALEKAGIGAEKIKSAMDSAINDALSSVGRNRQSLDAFKEEATNMRDAGLASAPALWLLESIANAANQSNSQVTKLFARMIYGFAIVPARVIRETAWFSPYGLVRLAVDAGMRNRNMDSRYAQSLGNEFQRQQRLNEAVAGTVALVALLALRAGSTDDPEDEDAFKIVFTGNGPKRNDDPQFYDSWYKAGNKPNTMSVSFGKGKFDLNMMRGFEAFTWPAMMLGALDDLEIRKKQKQKTNTPAEIEDAAIVAGFVFDAALRRGPYAFTTKSLFGTYGDIGVEGVAKGLTFPAKTLIPVLGTSLASNISNFMNDPIDRRTLDGAVWSNVPFIGPAVAPKSLNAFGEPALSTDLASKMFKLGVPIVYDIPTDRQSVMLHELVLKQGGGPSIPTRNQLAQRLDREPTNKEYEMFVKEYGSILTNSMKKNYDRLFNAKAEFYSKAVERIGNRARDVAENKVRQAAQKP